MLSVLGYEVSFVVEIVLVWASKGYRSTSPRHVLLLPLAYVVAVAKFILAHVAYVVGKELIAEKDGLASTAWYAS